jgi:PAS domain S-box-containing protein
VSNTKIAAELFGKMNPLTDTAKNFLAAIVASSDDAIISKDLDGIISSWNEGARRMFGYEAEEIVGHPILRLIPPELSHEEDFILSKIRSGERIEHFETTRVRKNGEKFAISVTISPIRNDSGEIIGASKIARDISDRRRLDESRFQLAALLSRPTTPLSVRILTASSPAGTTEPESCLAMNRRKLSESRFLL